MKEVREGYKMSELGEIPEEWEVRSTGDVFNFSGGLSISRAKLGEYGINYLHYGDIHKRIENYIDTATDEEWLPKLNDNYENIKSGVKLETGDVVFADASEDYEGIGKSVAIFNSNNKEFVAGLHTIVAKDKEKLLDSNYKRYCFTTNAVRSKFRFLATGTSVYGISRENIKKINILVPPLKEQEKIAQILSTVDSQIDNVDALIEKNKELKKGLMQKLLTEGIGHKEFKKTEIGEIPKAWEVKSLGEVFKLSSGNFLSQKDIVQGKYPVYGGNGVNGYHNKYLFEESKLVIGRVGAKCGCVHVSEPYCWITDNALYIDKKIEGFNNMYMYYLLDYINLNNYANQNAQPVISGQKIYSISIGMPSIDEQKQIASILSSVDENIEQYEDKKSKLEETKKGLMQQILTGKIRVVIKR
ncbi:restriction endonuclease subunit S [Clostridium sp.]|uniref:restriction endonuclease subunit S n=1 Tax=Clostridium sp. TaxID=1506 RepID=UPI0032174DA6